MNIRTLSDIIQAEKDIMEALEFAREEQSIQRTVETFAKLSERASDRCTNAKQLLNEERIRLLLRGLGRLNRAVRQMSETEIGVIET